MQSQSSRSSKIVDTLTPVLEKLERKKLFLSEEETIAFILAAMSQYKSIHPAALIKLAERKKRKVLDTVFYDCINMLCSLRILEFVPEDTAEYDCSQHILKWVNRESSPEELSLIAQLATHSFI